jgi:hypothetical protein
MEGWPLTIAYTQCIVMRYVFDDRMTRVTIALSFSLSLSLSHSFANPIGRQFIMHGLVISYPRLFARGETNAASSAPQ